MRLKGFKDLHFLIDIVFLTEGSTTPSSTTPPLPPKIIVHIRGPEFQIIETGGTVRYHCSGRSVDEVNEIIVILIYN